MKANLRLGMSWVALLLVSLPLLAQTGRGRPEPIDPSAPNTNRQLPDGLKPAARPAQPLAPAHSIHKAGAGARISAVTTETFNYSGAIVFWTVPAGVTSLTIEARGAEGGNYPNSDFRPGKGASITGTVAVTPGSQLKILVGQQGIGGNGGGGGTFVTDNNNNPS
ncbi:hypothetical protein [Salmonirosea aquatica]|uniref:Uncharacterized protein n=1 Tax=Salmonirosea aquatica TaxID=2654236 RepID=A0A7C9FZI5_9BACT|nr:hypothetical protein [Cytophagaceae bacterium SJW1-29]